MLLDAAVLTSLALAVVLGAVEPKDQGQSHLGRWHAAEAFLVGFGIGAAAIGTAFR